MEEHRSPVALIGQLSVPSPGNGGVGCGECRDSSEVTRPMLFLTTRPTLFIGKWIFRTM